MIPLISSANVTAQSNALTKSKCSSEGGLWGSSRSDIAKATSPIGILIANSHGHEATARIAAATLGPAADDTETTYQVGEFYTTEAEGGLLYDDPRLGLAWPLEVTEISEKDRLWAPLDEIEEDVKRRMTIGIASASTTWPSKRF